MNFNVKLPRFCRPAGTLLTGLMLSGCAALLPKPPSPVTEPLAVVADRLPNAQLTDGLLLQFLLSEVAAQRGSPGAAFISYMQMARETRDPRTAQRAVELALSARQPDGALQAAQLWRELAPNNREAWQLTAALLATQGKLDVLEALLVADLKKNPRPSDAIISAQQAIARSKDPAAGYALAQRIFAPFTRQVAAQIALSQAAFAAEQPAAALAHAELAYAAAPQSEQVALIRSQLRASADAPAAITVLTDYLKKNPTARNARLQLARLYASTKELAQAREQFSALAKPQTSANGITQRDPDALYALAILAIQTKDWPAATEGFKSYLSEIKNSPERDPSNALMSLASIAEEQRQYLQAAEWYGQVEAPEQLFIAKIRAALALSKAGQTDAAKQSLSSLKPRAEDDQVRLVLAQAQLARDSNQDAQAYEILTAGLKAAPDNPELLYDHATAAEKRNQFAEAEAQFRRLIALKPDNAQAYNGLGYALAERNLRLDEAQQLIEKAVKLAPDDGYILDSLGWLQYRQGKLTEALKTLNTAYAMRPDAEIAAHLGEVLWVSGQAEAAKNIWRSAQQIDPKNQTLINTLARFKVVLP